MNQSDPEKYRQESELIARVKSGDQAAFVELVTPLRIRLYRKAHSMLGNADDAEDALQDALITAYRAINGFRGESGFYTWIYRILVNKCTDHLRKKSNARSESFDDFEPLISDDRVSVEKKVEHSQQAVDLIAAINGLDKKYRKILIMRYYDDLSYQEIAHNVGINEGTVKSRLFKARELLKRALIGEGKGEHYFESSR